MARENGFFLLETVLLGLILMAAAEAFLLYSTTEHMRINSEAATTAAFLAQEQLALAEGQDVETLSQAVTLPWLGEGDAVEKNGYHYEVETILQETVGDMSLREVTVNISWTENHKNKKMSFQRVVKCRD